MRRLVTSGEQTQYVTLELVELADDDHYVAPPGRETAAVVLGGLVHARVGDADLGRAGGRRDVFEGPGHTVYAPSHAAVDLTAVGGRAELAVAQVAPGPAPPGPARIIGPGAQRVAHVGDGTWSRTVRTILGPDDPASRLLLGETVNPPGHWSSYPPHKHDTEAPPDEVRLEEVYLFRLDPRGGFAVQVQYDDRGDDRARLVHHDDVAVISSGYHPVVAAPGYALYYLWVMAGEGRTMAPHFDVRHAWVQEHT